MVMELFLFQKLVGDLLDGYGTIFISKTRRRSTGFCIKRIGETNQTTGFEAGSKKPKHNPAQAGAYWW
jgi:hypothetical protein